ncbi:MAG: lipid-A-disaccharide synthase N-terminal domain-containing protein [Planctomycetota bacterium]
MFADLVETVQQATPWYWHAVGYGGQIVFGSRFYVQWLHSEKHRRSVVPVLFWWLSLVGGLLTLAYAIYKLEGPFIMANIGGPPIYARNLWLIHRARLLPPAPPAAPLG